MDNEKFQESVLQALDKIFSELEANRQFQQDVREELATNRQFQQDVREELATNRQFQQDVREELATNRQFQQDVREELATNRQFQQDVQEELNDIKASQIRMEAKMDEHIGALYDAREVQKDTNHEIVTRLDRMEAKLDVLQLETAHLRRVK